MDEHDFSQLPVVHNDRLVGVFSYRSFAHVKDRVQIWLLDTPGANTHPQFRRVRMTAAGTYLAPYLSQRKIVELARRVARLEAAGSTPPRASEGDEGAASGEE